MIYTRRGSIVTYLLSKYIKNGKIRVRLAHSRFCTVLHNIFANLLLCLAYISIDIPIHGTARNMFLGLNIISFCNFDSGALVIGSHGTHWVRISKNDTYKCTGLLLSFTSCACVDCRDTNVLYLDVIV